jgi:uncharacterized protein (TIGR02453 family)
MTFSGWSPDAAEFYEGLEADNSPTYWTAHQDVYDNAVYAPMAALVTELAAELGAGEIAQPDRDVRFRKDKTPYATDITARMERGGSITFSAAGLTVGRGYLTMSPEQLDRYRRAVVDDASGAELAGIVDRLTAAQIQVNGSATLKTAPRGYPKDHPRIELLRYKGLFAWRQWPAGRWLGRPAAKGRVIEFLRTAAPLQVWLDERVGPDAPTGPDGVPTAGTGSG